MELVIPRKRNKRAGTVWSGDAKKSRTIDGGDRNAYRLEQLKVHTKDAEIREAVRKACKVKRTRAAAVTRFFERYVQEMEEQLRRRDQRGFFQHLNPWRWMKQGRWSPGVFAMRTGE